MLETATRADGVEICDHCQEPLDDCACCCVECGDHVTECACDDGPLYPAVMEA